MSFVRTYTSRASASTTKVSTSMGLDASCRRSLRVNIAFPWRFRAGKSQMPISPYFDFVRRKWESKRTNSLLREKQVRARSSRAGTWRNLIKSSTRYYAHTPVFGRKLDATSASNGKLQSVIKFSETRRIKSKQNILISLKHVSNAKKMRLLNLC